MVLAIVAVLLIFVIVRGNEGEQGDVSGTQSTPGLTTDKVIAFAQAIAHAEGFNLGPGTIPYDRNNPGDIVVNGQIATFPDIDTGWQKLYNKIDFDFISGQSTVYRPTMTFREAAWMWVNGTVVGGPLRHRTDSPDGWAQVVAGDLGVDVDSTIQEYFNG